MKSYKNIFFYYMFLLPLILFLIALIIQLNFSYLNFPAKKLISFASCGIIFYIYYLSKKADISKKGDYFVNGKLLISLTTFLVMSIFHIKSYYIIFIFSFIIINTLDYIQHAKKTNYGLSLNFLCLIILAVLAIQKHYSIINYEKILTGSLIIDFSIQKHMLVFFIGSISSIFFLKIFFKHINITSHNIKFLHYNKLTFCLKSITKILSTSSIIIISWIMGILCVPTIFINYNKNNNKTALSILLFILTSQMFLTFTNFLPLHFIFFAVFGFRYIILKNL